MLEEATIPVTLAGGVDTKTDEKLVPATGLTKLENGVFTKALSVAKRYGYEEISLDVFGTDVRLPTGTALVVKKGSHSHTGHVHDDLLLLTNDKAYSYGQDTDTWKDIGDVVRGRVISRSVAKTTSEQTRGDFAEAGGVTVYAWEDTRGGVWYSVHDAESDATLLRASQLASGGSYPRVFTVGTQLHIYYADTANGYIYLAIVDPANATVAPTPILLVEDLDKSIPSYDLDVWTQGDGVNVASPAANLAWHTDAGEIGLCFVLPTGEIGRPLNGLPARITYTPAAALTGGLTICIDPLYDTGAEVLNYVPIFCVYNTASTLYYKGWNILLTAGSGIDGSFPAASPRDAITACFQEAADSDGHRVCHIFGGDAGTLTEHSYVRMPSKTLSTDVSTTAPVLAYGSGLVSKAFRNSALTDHVFVNIGWSSTYYQSYFALRNDGLIAGRCLVGQAGDEPSDEWLPTPKAISTAITAWIGGYKEALDTDDNDVYDALGLRRIEYLSSNTRTAQLGKSLYAPAGGFLAIYDGDSFVEMPHYAIDDVGAPVLSTSGTGGLGNGVYIYRFVIEYVLANGETLRGPVSVGTTVTITGGEDTATFAIPTYRLTKMTTPRGEVRIGVYRTEVNDTALYRVSDLDPSNTAAAPNNFIYNDPTAATVAFIDAMDDATLIAREPLYTNGGILPNDPVPCGDIVIAGKNRLFFTDADNGLKLRYSQELASGYAVETSPELSIDIDPFGGSVITGLAVMDDTVVIFKEEAIFVLGGDGPLANPSAGGGFSKPQLIPSGVGCKDARSVAIVPPGVVFQSEAGIYLLDRGRNVSYIGAPVEDYNSQTVTSVEVLRDRNEVRFLTLSGYTLCWNYYFNAWSTFTNYEGYDAAVLDGTYYFLRDDGRVVREDSSYTDLTTSIPFVIETAWIKMRNLLQGFQMIWNLEVVGEYRSAHTLKVWIQFDYEPGWYQAPWEIDPSEFYDAQNYGDGVYGDGVYGGEHGTHAYQVKLHVAEACEAFKLRFAFTESYGVNGACAELSEILVTGGVTARRKPLGNTRSY